jgi:hypothetical protein
MGRQLAGEAEKLAFRIEPFGLKHDRAAFSCGVDLLNVYLRKQAARRDPTAIFMFDCLKRTRVWLAPASSSSH